MVVKYLQGLMSRTIPGGVEPVSIPDLITKYKEDNEDAEPPVIVMDASSAGFAFTADLNTMCNGSFKGLRQNVINFHERITALGAKLVVFFQGSCEFETKENWMEKNFRRRHEVHKHFDRLYQNEKVESVPGQSAAGSMCFKSTVLSLPGCQVFCALNECDAAIVEYVSQHKVLAVMGQDSDYLIYNNIPLYISISDLKLKTLESVVYVRSALSKYLNLSYEKFPLFATLMGNEIISYDYLVRFHKRLIGQRPYKQTTEVFLKVAQYVNTLPVYPDIYSELGKVARYVFNDESFAPDLERSVRMYMESKKHSSTTIQDAKMAPIIEVATKLKCACKISSTTHFILTNNTSQVYSDLEDLRRGKYQSAARLSRPLRERMYGILLFDSDCDTVTDRSVEYIENTSIMILERVVVQAVKPRVHHPGLLRLWTDSSSELEDMKWALFCDAVSDKLQPEHLKILPRHLVIPTAALFYLQQEPPVALLEPFQLAAFLITALKMENMTVEELKAIHMPRPDPQAIELSSKYLRSVFYLDILNDSCGFVLSKAETCPSQYFDGKLFQQIYSKLKSGVSFEQLLIDKVVQAAMFGTLIQIINNRFE